MEKQVPIIQEAKQNMFQAQITSLIKLQQGFL